MTMSINGSMRVLGVLWCGLSAGCGASPDDSSESGDTLGTASIALTQVPSPVQCIRVVASGSSVVTTNLSVAIGSSSASLNIGRLPLGPVQFSASAFDLPCSSVGTAAPSWVADPVSTTLRAGVPTTVSLTFRTDNSVTVNANFVQSALELNPHHGGNGNGLIMADGSIRITGFSWSLGAYPSYTNPGLTDIQTGASGAKHNCFVRKSNGSVACVGNNEFGQLGPGVPIGGDTSTLTTVPLPSTFGRARQVAAGRDFTCAIPEAAPSNVTDIYCWGNNARGQLGVATTGTFSATPVRVNLGANDGIFAGDQFACTISFGDPYCWGANSFGQLGDGTTTDRTTPVPVVAGNGFIAAASLGLGFYHACAVTAAGGALCWGNNSNGQLGNGTTNTSTLAMDVTGLGPGSNVVQIAGGVASTFARFADGTVRVWGSSTNGELGLGDRKNRNTPTPLTSIQDVAQIASSGSTTLALLSDRTVLGWGDNANFNIGDGTRSTRYVPTRALTQ